jgi:hypothetical protein
MNLSKRQKFFYGLKTTITLVLVLVVFLISNKLPEVAKAATSPQGLVEKVNCAYISGWAFDPDIPSLDSGIAIYVDGPFGVGALLGNTSANRKPSEIGLTGNIQAATGDGNRHGFMFYVPNSIKTNQVRNIYVYALDATGDPATLISSDRSLQCKSGNSQVTNNVDGIPLSITTTDRLAGAVDSLNWKGKEFVNTYDHGRQIQYAWTENGWGECQNPTEAGSHYDDVGTNSTTILKDISVTGNKLTTITNPAYWALPGTNQTFCQKVNTAKNTDLATPQTMTKTMEIGYAGLDNVIKTEIKLNHNTQDLTELKMQMPTGYLTPDFNQFYRFNPQSGQLNPVAKDPKYAGSIFTYNRNEALPVILATPDGKHAMGVYTSMNSNNSNVNYALLEYPNSDPSQASNIWSINYQNGYFPVGEHTFTSYMIVGDLATVQESMKQLYQVHPTDVQMPQGSLDYATCEATGGWAFDPKMSSQIINVQIFTLDNNKNEIILGNVPTNIFRPDINNIVTGGSGSHGFEFAMPNSVKDGKDHLIYARAINTNPNLVNPYIGGGLKINCPPPVVSSSSSISVLSSSSSTSISSSSSSISNSNSSISSPTSSTSISSQSLSSTSISSNQSSNSTSSILSSLSSNQTSTAISSSSSNQQVACTADVRQCSDGTYVSRDSLNNCNFFACPIISSSSTQTSSSLNSSIPISISSSSTSISSQSLSSTSISSNQSSNSTSSILSSLSSTLNSSISSPSTSSISSSNSSGFSSSNQPPTFVFNSPVNNQEVCLDKDLIFSVDANDLDGTVAKVEFYQSSNNQKIGEDLNGQNGWGIAFSSMNNPFLVGNHTVYAVVTDNSGNFSLPFATNRVNFVMKDCSISSSSSQVFSSISSVNTSNSVSSGVFSSSSSSTSISSSSSSISNSNSSISSPTSSTSISSQSLSSTSISSNQSSNSTSSILSSLSSNQTSTAISSSSSNQQVACTADVRQCSDGTYVSRDSLNNCNFFACPIISSSSTQTSSSLNSSIPISISSSSTSISSQSLSSTSISSNQSSNSTSSILSSLSSTLNSSISSPSTSSISSTPISSSQTSSILSSLSSTQVSSTSTSSSSSSIFSQIVSSNSSSFSSSSTPFLSTLVIPRNNNNNGKSTINDPLGCDIDLSGFGNSNVNIAKVKIIIKNPQNSYSFENLNTPNGQIIANIDNSKAIKTVQFSLNLKQINIPEGQYTITTSILDNNSNVLAKTEYIDIIKNSPCFSTQNNSQNTSQTLSLTSQNNLQTNQSSFVSSNPNILKNIDQTVRTGGSMLFQILSGIIGLFGVLGLIVIKRRNNLKA